MGGYVAPFSRWPGRKPDASASSHRARPGEAANAAHLRLKLSISQELRTPLSGIGVQTVLMQAWVGGPYSNTKRKFLDDIHVNTDALPVLIERPLEQTEGTDLANARGQVAPASRTRSAGSPTRWTKPPPPLRATVGLLPHPGRLP